MRKISLLLMLFMAVCLNMQAQRTVLWESADPVKVEWGQQLGKQEAGVAANWSVGDKLIVTCTGKTDEDDYPQVVFKDAAWDNINPSVQLRNVKEFPYEGVFTLTESMIETMQGGFWISGTAVYVSKLEYEPNSSTVDTSNAIWLGENTYPDTNWWSGTDAISVGAAAFASAQEGDVIEFRASVASDKFLVQPFFGGWNGTSKNSDDLPNLFVREGNTISYTLTADDVTALKQGGLVVQAGGCTLNVVALLPVGGEAPVVDRFDLDLSSNSLGWGSELTGNTMTFTGAWGMRGIGTWGDETSDYSAFDYAVVEFAAPTEIEANLVIYGSGENYAEGSFNKYCVRKVMALPDFKDAVARIGIMNKTEAGSVQIAGFYLCTEAYKTENNMADAYEQPERFDLDLTNLGSGWDSTYNPNTKKITIEGDWAGRGWWYGNADYSKYQYLVVKFDTKTPDQGNIMVESAANDNDNITGHFDWRCLQRVIDVSNISANIKQVYFQAPAGTVLYLDEAYFCTEEYKNENQLEDIYEPFFELDENAAEVDFSAISGQRTVDLRLVRTTVPGIWNTFCLPYSVPSPEAIGADEIMVLDSYDPEANELHFVAATSEVPAGEPFLFKTQRENYDNLPIWNVDVEAMVTEPVAKEGVFFGTFTKRTLEEGDFFVSKTTNLITKGNAGTDMPGLRGYFHFDNQQAAPTVIFVDEVTGISTLRDARQVFGTQVYNLSGQVVGTTDSQLPRGIYVVNGKKFVVR